MKIVSIVGARPQFIKAAMVSRAGTRIGGPGYQEVIVHTGQHYEDLMSGVFFRELEIPSPKYNLGVGSGSPGRQTGRMLEALERVLMAETPDCAVVFGDTNTTLAGALASVKLGIPLVHVEAGLRSYNRIMPEEHNRVLTDHCAELLLCPTESSVARLREEGITAGVRNVGDVMFDILKVSLEPALERSAVLSELSVEPGRYVLATIHRSYNTDDPARLERIIRGLEELPDRVILTLHPRTRDAMAKHGIGIRSENVLATTPVSYFDMLVLEKEARLVVTDSGGVQKEAYMVGTPCATLRTETEWTETVEAGWNRLVNVDTGSIGEAMERATAVPDERPPLFGGGNAAELIVESIVREFGG